MCLITVCVKTLLYCGNSYCYNKENQILFWSDQKTCLCCYVLVIINPCCSFPVILSSDIKHTHMKYTNVLENSTLIGDNKMKKTYKYWLSYTSRNFNTPNLLSQIIIFIIEGFCALILVNSNSVIWIPYAVFLPHISFTLPICFEKGFPPGLKLLNAVSK